MNLQHLREIADLETYAFIDNDLAMKARVWDSENKKKKKKKGSQNVQPVYYSEGVTRMAGRNMAVCPWP